MWLHWFIGSAFSWVPSNVSPHGVMDLISDSSPRDWPSRPETKRRNAATKRPKWAIPKFPQRNDWRLVYKLWEDMNGREYTTSCNHVYIIYKMICWYDHCYLIIIFSFQTRDSGFQKKMIVRNSPSINGTVWIPIYRLIEKWKPFLVLY